MKTLLLTLVVFVASALPVRSDYTPRPASPERRSICDAAREFVLSKYATGTLPQSIRFKIDHLRAQGRYCNFEAVTIFQDGSNVAPKYMADIVLNFCLREIDGEWQVIVDLSRTDVPTDAELAQIKRRLPFDFPRSLFSPTWRDLLSKAP
jgi:hypothetical protein